MLNAKKKQKIIQKFRTHAKDTGSPQVQIAILTEEMKELADHLKTHKKDHSSRRGLLKKVGERRRLLRYLEKEDSKGFEELAKSLKLKAAKKFEIKKEEEPKKEVAKEVSNKKEAAEKVASEKEKVAEG